LPVASTPAISACYVAVWLTLFFTTTKAPELIMIRRSFSSVFVSFQAGLPNAPDCGSIAAFASSNPALLGAKQSVQALKACVSYIWKPRSGNTTT